MMMATAKMNAAKMMARAMFCFSRISFQIFSGVIISMSQKEKTRIAMPINE